jgi:hypothetical protein
MPMPRVNPTGVTEIEAMVGAVTVSVVDWVTLPSVAEMVVEPAAIDVAKPLASIDAVEVEDELQLTRAVRSRLLPSL